MDACSVETPAGPEYKPLPILIPCLLCNRKFLPESLVRHKKACEKVLMKKRKQFDSAKQRLTGELAECLPLPPAKLKRASPARKSSRWKEKHLELLETLRAARVGLNGGSAPLLNKPADHEQCPHCGRSFGPKAFDRHEEYCREKFSRLEHRPSVSTQAKERLEARTKYRAPCVKSRRSITREKYLPANMKREPSPGSNAGNNNNPPLAPVITRAESKPALTKQNSISNTKENDVKATPSTGSHFVRASRNTSSFRASQRRPSKASSVSSNLNLVTPKPQPLAPNNRSEPPIRQTLQTLPSNMKIKKEMTLTRSSDVKKKQAIYKNSSNPGVIRSNREVISSNRDDNEDEITITNSAVDHEVNVSDLIDLSTPRQDMEYDAQIYSTYKVSTSKFNDQDVCNTCTTSNTHKFNTHNTAAQKNSKLLSSEHSSSDSGFGSFDVNTMEMRKQYVNNNLGTDDSSNSQYVNKNLNNNEKFAKITADCFQMNKSSVTSETSNGISNHHTLEKDLMSLRTPIDYHETFQQYKLEEKIRSLQTSNLKLRGNREIGEKKNLVNDNFTQIKPRNHSHLDQNIKLEQEIAESDCNDNLYRSLDSISCVSELSTSDADTSSYKQCMAHYNKQINGFIENAFKKSSSQITLTSNNSNYSLEETGSTNSRSGRKRKVKRHNEGSDVSDEAAGISTIISSGKKETPKKTPNKRLDKIQHEEKPEYRRKEKVASKVIKVNLDSSGTKSDTARDTSGQSSCTGTTRDDPYDSLEEDNNINSNKLRIKQNNPRLFELFSNEHYIHEDDNSSIAESELIAIAAKMNQMCGKTNRSELSQNPGSELGRIETEKIVNSKTSSENHPCKKLLVLRNTKKSCNFLEVAKSECNEQNVVIETLQTISSRRDEIKTSGKNSVKNTNKSQLLSHPHKKEKNGPIPRSGRKDKNEKLPPIILKPNFKHKANEVVPKRGSNSTCPTLPSVSNMRKRAVSRIPQPKISSTSKISLPEVASKRTIREKMCIKKLDPQKHRWKSPPLQKLPKVPTNESKNSEKSKIVVDIILPVEKLPEVYMEPVASTTLTTADGGANKNTELEKLCDPNNDSEQNSKREDRYDPFASAEKQMKELLSFSLKTEKIEPSPSSNPKSIFLKALPLPYYDHLNNPNIKSPAHLDNSQNQSICSMESFLSKSGSQSSLDQSILSIENVLDETNLSLDNSTGEQILDQNGNAEEKSPAVKATRTKSVDYVIYGQSPSVHKDYVRSKSIASASDLSLAAMVNFEHLQKSHAESNKSLSNKSVSQSRESLSNKSATINLSRESLSNKSVSSGSKRSTLNSPDILERPNSQSKSHSHKSIDNLSDHLDNRSPSPSEAGRKSSQSMRDEKVAYKSDINLRKSSNEKYATAKCISPFDQIRNGSGTPASLDSILGRKNSLDEFTAAELLAELSQNSSRKSSVCSDCSQVMSRKNSSAGFLPDIARCGAKEHPVPRGCERNINHGSNTSNLSFSRGDDIQGRMTRSAGGLEPLRRSTSLFEPPERHPARSKSRGKISCDERSLPKLDNLVEHRQPVTALGDLDLVEAELLQSVSEFEKIFDLSSSSSSALYSSPYANSTLQEGSIFSEEKNSNGGKVSGDSAYNSLNRKTTDEQTSSNSSSSGSESSFPNHTHPAPKSNAHKFSKFCHECGTQYPLATAKFCCQCGVRRLCVA